MVDSNKQLANYTPHSVQVTMDMCLHCTCLHRLQYTHIIHKVLREAAALSVQVEAHALGHVLSMVDSIINERQSQ